MNNITITLPSGKQKSVQFGKRTSILINEEEFNKGPFPLIGLKLNNELVCLSRKMEINTQVKPVYLNEKDGLRIYRDTLCYLLTMAFDSLYPEKRLIIGHSLGHGFYYHTESNKPFSIKEMSDLNKKMRELVIKEYPITRNVLSYEESLEMFKKYNQLDTVDLLSYKNNSSFPVYECNNFRDYAFTPLAYNTSLIKHFELKAYQNGLLLRFPPATDPTEINHFNDHPLLYSVYQEYKDWGKILHVESVGKLNQKISEKEDKHFIRIAESLHNKKISEIADRIQEKRKELRVVLIAGPSSSGKTTFTKKLSIQLQVVGFNPQIISLDNYYYPPEEVPCDDEGKPDFEALEALDVKNLNANLIELFETGETEIPIFNFKLGKRMKKGTPLKTDERSILLIEGIHGLNDKLTPQIDKKLKFKIYVSALTQLNLDDHNRIPTTDNRLIRRIVRDHQFRGTSAKKTLQMWNSVRRGENKYIFPYQDKANAIFNSALDYELSVLKIYADPLLKMIKPNEEEYSEALRLLAFLDHFSPLPAKHTPDFSILREFIGDSGFHY